jgi:hypothetical protein
MLMELSTSHRRRRREESDIEPRYESTGKPSFPRTLLTDEEKAHFRALWEEAVERAERENDDVK